MRQNICSLVKCPPIARGMRQALTGVCVVTGAGSYMDMDIGGSDTLTSLSGLGVGKQSEFDRRKKKKSVLYLALLQSLNTDYESHFCCERKSLFALKGYNTPDSVRL